MGVLDAPLTPPFLARAGKFTESIAGTGLVPVGTKPRSFMDTMTRLSDGTALGRFFRLSDAVAVDVAGPRLVYGNRWFSSTTFLESGGPNRIFVHSAIVVPADSNTGAVVFPVTFGGASVGVIEPGKLLVADAVPGLVLLAGKTFYTQTWVSVANLGEKWPLAVPVTVSANGEGYAATDLSQNVNAGSGIIGTAVAAYGPLGVLGVSSAPSLLGDGDSIGLGYSGSDPAGIYTGFISRALNGGFGWVTIATDGERADHVTTAGGIQVRSQAALNCKYAIVHFGRNDLSGGRTAAQIEVDLISHGRVLATMGIKPFACTVPPRTTTTDSYATLANQTVHASEAERVALNVWIRGGMPINATTKAPVAVGTGGAKVAGDVGHPYAGKFDTCAGAESSQDSGKWKVTGAANYATTDGIHPTGAVYVLMAAQVTTASFV